MRCTQGPFASFSHKGINAIDVAANTPGKPFWFHAPIFCDKKKRNCVVTRVGHHAFFNSAGQLVDCGGRVLIEVYDPGVRRYRIDVLHVTYGVTQGQPLGSYEPIAHVTHSAAWNKCSSGLHAHVEIQHKNIFADTWSNVSPYPVLTSEPYNCAIGSCP